MYFNNNLSQSRRNPLQALQQEVQSLNSQLVKWKIIIAQLPHPSTLPSQPYLPQIHQKLDSIHQITLDFIRKFEREMFSANEKVSRIGNVDRMGNPVNEHKMKSQEEKFQLVNDKINLLEANLKKTQESEQKLVETLNFMMRKYDDMEQSKIRNQEYYNTTLANSEAKSSSLFPFQTCGGVKGPKNEEKNKGKNIHLINEASFQLDYSYHSHSVPQSSNRPSETSFRMFSQNEPPKLSLKSTASRHQDRGGLMFKDSRDQDTKRSSVSTEKNEHRFKFMMANLGQ